MKDKNSVTVVEGELAHFRSLLVKLQQQPPQKPTQQKNNQTLTTTVSNPLKEKKSAVVDVMLTVDDSEQFTSSSTDQQTSVTSDNTIGTTSDVTNIPNLVNAATTGAGNITSDCTNSPLSLRKKLNPKVTKESRTNPGQKIANVVKKLSQERNTYAPNITAVEEVTFHNEDRSTRKSLDAVVAQLHIVKKQEFDKQFHVDLGSAKQVRENTKLDSVVEMLVAKQSQSQLLSSDYPLNFEPPATTTKVNTGVDSSPKCMEADVSSTVPDNVEGSNVDMETQSVITEASKAKDKFQTMSTKSADEPVIVAGVAERKEKRQENINDSVINTALTKQAVQMKSTTGPKSISKVETARTATDGKTARSKEQTGTKDRISISGLPCLPAKLPTGVPVTSIMLTSRIQCTLAKVNKFMTEKFAITPKNLEGLLGKDSSKEISNDSISGNLTEYYFENSQVDSQLQNSVSDAVFIKLLQVLNAFFFVCFIPC